MAGQTVQLTERQAQAFRDKFDGVLEGQEAMIQRSTSDDGGQGPIKNDPTRPAPPTPGDGKPAPTSGKAQDAGSKTPVGEVASNVVPQAIESTTVGTADIANRAINAPAVATKPAATPAKPGVPVTGNTQK
jgi:hypothetical protein